MSRCIDDLDCACRNHDRDCSHPDGCSKKADDALLKVAKSVSKNAITRIFRPNKAKASDKIIAAITVARRIRKR